MSHWVERLLNLRHGDLARGILLFAYYFLIIAAFVIGQVVRDALFLDRFTADQLPYADISVALLVGFVVAAYIRAGRAYNLRDLLTGSLGLFSGMAFFFWWAFRSFGWDWLFLALYIWVGIFGVLAITQVWTLANFVLTTREAKRLFGLVGSGGILGGIFGGFLSNSLADRLGTESLLAVLAVFLGVCTVLVVFIWRQRQSRSDTLRDAGSVGSEESPWSLSESVHLVLASSHLKSIATLICITSIVTTAAGWQFKAIAEQAFAEKDAMAAFFGSFQGFAGALSLLAQLLLTTRVLQRFGVGLALFILPVTLLFGSFGVLVSGSLLAATLLKGSDKVLRYSIDTTALQLLYLPVPTNIKVQVKSFIDTVIWRLGDGLAGLTLLIFATYLNFTPARISWVMLVFLGVWFVAADRARRQYLATLEDRVHEHRLDTERATAPVLDRSTTTILAAKLNSADTEEILYGLDLFEMGYHQAAHPSMQDLIHHDSPEVRARALVLLNAAGDKSVIGTVETLLQDEDFNVRTEALLYLTHHSPIDPLERIRELGDFPDFTVRSSIAGFLARPGKAQNLEVARMMLDMMIDEGDPDGKRMRLEAARLVRTLPDPFEAQLSRLLEDRDPEVAKYAIEAVGKIPRLRYVPALLDWLGDSECRDSAVHSLTLFGNRILGTLYDYLNDLDIPAEVRREIPMLVTTIGTPEAQHALVENLFQGDTSMRYAVLSALNKFQQTHPEIHIDKQLIETILAAEIMGHYRSYQALGALETKLEGNDPSLTALRESIGREIERIFRLLGILLPEHDLHAVYLGLQSDNARVRDNTIEFLDNMLRPELRSLLVPLVDDGVSVPERVQLANQLVGTGVETPEEAVAMLMHSGDPWLKSCAAYAIGTLGLKSLEPELNAWQDDPDPLLSETVRQAKVRLANLQ